MYAYSPHFIYNCFVFVRFLFVLLLSLLFLVWGGEWSWVAGGGGGCWIIFLGVVKGFGSGVVF